MRNWLPFTLLLCPYLLAGGSNVELIGTPNDGIQPQAVFGANGVLHLIYFKGSPSEGDIFYVRRQQDGEEFSKPMRVNSRTGSAIAAGSIRGAQMALGRNGRIHVAWMGTKNAEQAVVNGEPKTPMIYTRLNDEGTAFEPERNVLTWAAGLDGGGTVATDQSGNVYVAWHGAGTSEGEESRAVYVARSRDDGKIFAREEQANRVQTGACACCGMKAFADRDGNLHLLYRAAYSKGDRHMTWLISEKSTAPFNLVTLSQWNIMMCPMSSASTAQGPRAPVAAWETEGQIHFAILNNIGPRTSSSAAPKILSPPDTGKRKHPSIAQNNRGDILLAWIENSGWAKGGTLAWQLFDSSGKPLGEKNGGAALKPWSLLSAVAKSDGSFLIVY